jgi:DNA-binding protein Fis
MPEFNVDLSPKNQPTSLADLLKLQSLSAQGDVAQQEAAKAKQAGMEREIFQGFMQSGRWKNANGDIDIDIVNSTLPAIMPLTGFEYAAKLNQVSKNTIEARDAQLNFDQKERGVVASVYASLANAGIQDPKVYSAALENLKTEFPNSKNIHRYIDSAISNLKIGTDPNKPNPELPKNALLKSNELLSLEKQYELASPKAALTTVGGQTAVTTTTPSFGGSKPKIEVEPLGGGGSGNAPTPASTQTNKPSSKLPKLIPEDESLKYTPQASGITNTNKFQDAAYERGNEIVKTANASLQGQANLQESIRKVEKHYQVASGSKAGQLYEKTKQYLLGNEELDTLKKSIAQVQARNAELMGLNRSDASQQLNEKLSGNENIDPKALEGIMQQVKAESKAAEMFTKGINKYLDMRGDINGKIQAEKFKSKWSEHYDPRIFQVFNISESNIPEDEKNKRISEITSKMTSKEFDKYKKDSEIIHRLNKGLHQ